MQQMMRYPYGPRRHRQATRRSGVNRTRQAAAVTAVAAQRRIAGKPRLGERAVRYAFDLIKIVAVLVLMYAFLLLMFVHGG